MRSAAILALVLVFGAPVPIAAEVTIQPVRSGIHVIDGATDRIGVSSGPDGILLVDGGYMETAGEVKAAVASLGRGDAKVMINTHWHHAFGNAAFADARIIAHRNVAKRMVKPNLMFNRIVPAAAPQGLPDQTFETTYRMKFNGETIDIIGFPPAHTDSDAIVIFRGSNVVFTGDLFVPHLPWIDYGSGGSVEGYLGAVDRLVEIVPRDALLIPGHGPTSRYADLVAFRDAIRELIATLRQQIGEGRSLAEVQAAPMPDKVRTFVKRGGIPLELVLESFYKGLNPDKTSTPCEFVNGRWFDGREFKPQAGFWIEGGALTLKKPALVQCVVDLGDSYVLPPLAESHTHKLGTEQSIREDGSDFLKNGIYYAMVQDPANEASAALKTAASTPHGLEAVYTQGVIAPSWGVIPQFYRMMADRGLLGEGMTYEKAADNLFFTVDDRDDLERKWPAIAARNDRFVKVILAFSEEWQLRRKNPKRYGAKPPQYSRKPGLDPALLPPLVTKAHAAGLKVSVHVETAADFRAAVTAGADYIAHLPGSWQIGEKTGFGGNKPDPWLLTPADAAEARRREVKVITTAFRPPDDPDRQLRQAVHRHNLRLLDEAGVTLMVGSDSFQQTVVDEILYLQDLQVVPPAKLLYMATRATPQAMFPGRKLGELKEGFEASFLMFDRNPLENPAILKMPVMRVKKGLVLGGTDQP